MGGEKKRRMFTVVDEFRCVHSFILVRVGCWYCFACFRFLYVLVFFFVVCLCFFGKKKFFFFVLVTFCFKKKQILQSDRSKTRVFFLQIARQLEDPVQVVFEALMNQCVKSMDVHFSFSAVRLVRSTNEIFE